MKKIGLFDKITGKGTKDKKQHKSVGEASSANSKSPAVGNTMNGQSVQAIITAINLHSKLSDNGQI